MALMEAVIKAIYEGQEIINRFNYVSTGTPAAVSLSFALTSALGAIYNSIAMSYPSGTVLSAMRGIQVEDLVYQEIAVKNVYSVTDFYGTPFVPTMAGSFTSAGASPAISAKFTSTRVVGNIRRGQKAIGGVPIELFGAGGAINPAHETLMTTLNTRLSEVLTYNDEGNVLSFSPTIVSRESYTTSSGKTAYRYYETETEQLTHVAIGIGWGYKGQSRTQRSRQYGVGS